MKKPTKKTEHKLRNQRMLGLFLATAGTTDVFIILLTQIELCRFFNEPFRLPMLAAFAGYSAISVLGVCKIIKANKKLHKITDYRERNYQTVFTLNKTKGI